MTTPTNLPDIGQKINQPSENAAGTVVVSLGQSEVNTILAALAYYECEQRSISETMKDIGATDRAISFRSAASSSRSLARRLVQVAS